MSPREMSGLEIFQAEGILLAHATATCAILRPQSG